MRVLPAPEAGRDTDAVVDVRVEWSDGRAETLGATNAPYFHRVVARIARAP